MSRRTQAPPLVYPDAPQRDHVAEHITTCPTCGGPWKAAKRVCRKCGQPIGRTDKWHTVPVGPGTFAYEHREACGIAPAPERADAHWLRGCAQRLIEVAGFVRSRRDADRVDMDAASDVDRAARVMLEIAKEPERPTTARGLEDGD